MQRNLRKRLILLVTVVAAVTPAFASMVSVDLGTASNFGLLGGTITSTGNSNVTGDVGATTSLAGFPPGTASGTVFASSNPAVTTAYNSFQAAFASAASLAPTQTLLSGLTSNQTFTGNNVYSFSTTNIATTQGITLTFNAQGNANEIFVIQIPGNLTVDGSINFVLENGAVAHNIFWIVGADDPSKGAAAEINLATSPVITFDGNILAGGLDGSFDMSAGVGRQRAGIGMPDGTINGCVLTGAAEVLHGRTTINGCDPPAAPEPGSLGLASIGCLLGALAWRKRRSAPSAGRLS
jgi:hypothetical protein